MRDVFASPAVAVLCRLEAGGFDVRVDGADVLVRPSSLPADLQAAVRQYKSELRALVACCDAGTQARRLAFVDQLATAKPTSVPALVFQAGLPYAHGRCYSCGAALGAPRFGRCWRCELAWRLTLRVPVSTDTMSTGNQMQRVA